MGLLGGHSRWGDVDTEAEQLCVEYFDGVSDKDFSESTFPVLQGIPALVLAKAQIALPLWPVSPSKLVLRS
jgi:hypothetical protein